VAIRFIHCCEQGDFIRYVPEIYVVWEALNSTENLFFDTHG